MERPSYSTQLLFDLKTACTTLVNQTNPPDPDDDIEPMLLETLRKVEAERKAKLVAAQARAADAKSQKGEVRESKSKQKQKPRLEESRKELAKRYSSTRPPVDLQKVQTASEANGLPARNLDKQVHVPTGSNTKATWRKASETVKSPTTQSAVEAVAAAAAAIADVHNNHAPNEIQGAARRQSDDAALHEIRQSIHARPKTSAAACVDYSGPVSDDGSSKSTSRSTSNYDALHRPTSTGLTSLAQTPGEEKRRSHLRRPSDESYQEALAIEQAAIWRKEQELQLQAEEYANSGRAARPASRTSKLSRMTSRSEFADRPPSRAGSLASSIASGINHYIRPRASVDNMRSGRSSAMGQSRPQSRSSSLSRRSSGFWRRNSLRRNGSWASFRSGRLEREERKARKNGEPNLNRPLPALPGLDQYKETKTHIGQLMKAGVGGKKKVNKNNISEPQPLAPANTEPTATLPKPATPILDRTLRKAEEERARQAPSNGQQQQHSHRQDHHHHHSHSHRHRHQQHEKEQGQDNHPHHDQARRSTLPKNMESSHRSHKGNNKRQSQTQPPPRRSTAPTFKYSEYHQESELYYQKPSASRSKTESQTSPSQTLSPTMNKANLYQMPPIIRGASYNKELENGVYPRPMDVNTGGIGPIPTSSYFDVRLIDVGSSSRGRKSPAHELNEVSEGHRTKPPGHHHSHGHSHNCEAQKEDDRRRGIKSRMGKMFGSSNGNGNGGTGGAPPATAAGHVTSGSRRRTVAAN